MAPGDSHPSKLTLARYGSDARALVVSSQALADERGHAELQPLHLLSRLLERSAGAVAVFRAAGVDVSSLNHAVASALDGLPRVSDPAYLSRAMLDLLSRAEQQSTLEASAEVTVGYLLDALSRENRGVTGELLASHGITPGSLRPHLSILDQARPSAVADYPSETPSAIRDIVKEARSGLLDPTLLRHQETLLLLSILERRYGRHPLIVGEPGVGRTALVHGLAQRIATGDVPTSLAQTRLLELQVGVLVAGARLRSDVELRARRLIDSLARSKTEVVVMVRNVEQIFGQGSAGSGLGDALKVALVEDRITLLGTTTPDGLRRLQDRDPDVQRWFTPLTLEEPSPTEALQIVRGVASRYQEHHQVDIEEGAIVAATQLAKRYLRDRRLPGSAVELLDEAASTLRVESDGLGPDQELLIQRYESARAQVQSLRSATDAASQRIRAELDAEVAELEERVDRLRELRESRRGSMAAVRSLRAEIGAARTQLQSAKSDRNFARVGELEHAILPELEARLKRALSLTAGQALGRPCLDDQAVARTVALRTGIPVARMLEDEAEKLRHMEERLQRRIIGQPEAVRAVARAIRRSRVGLSDSRRPIGSFLFLGPSGVGKTELAKALAEFLFDDERSLTRLDMSEFMERHMAQRLVGAPPGYADSEQGGFLTEAVRRRPYSVLLFDEVEKAHADVFNLLLQVLDDGRLTDGRGQLADFSNAVVVMTSNIGSRSVLDASPDSFESESSRAAISDQIKEQLREFFRPEMLNRIDDTIVFRPLDRAALGQIAELQIAGISRMLNHRGLSLAVEPQVVRDLVEQAYEPALGARPIRRAIARRLLDPLAEALLDNRYQSGSTVHVNLTRDEQLQIEVVPVTEPDPDPGSAS